MPVPDLAPPTPVRPIVDERAEMSQEFRNWTQLVSKLSVAEGSGSPEGVIEAEPTKQYMDTAGTAGAILYIKRDADVAGDRTKGWILV